MAEMSEDWQRDVARFISSMVTSFDHFVLQSRWFQLRQPSLHLRPIEVAEPPAEIERRLGEEE